MSLQVWLPFISNKNNQGLLKLPTPSFDNLVANSSGKLGGCYKQMMIYHLSEEFLGNVWSLSAWCKSDAWPVNGNAIILCKNTDTAAGAQFYMSVVSGTRFNIGINGSTSTCGVDYNFAANTWYHLTVTFDGAYINMYINGNLVKTQANTSSQLTGKFNLGIGCRSNNADGTTVQGGTIYMNDVRIYDHCLSPKEVKEISQGLVLHYKLDDAYVEGTTNLGGTSVNYSNEVYGNPYTANGWGGDAGTVTFYSSGGYNNGPYKVYHKTATGTGGIFKKTANDITIVSGKTYTMSIYVKASRDYTDSVYSFNINGVTATDSNHYITVSPAVHFTTEWQRISRTFTATDNDAGTYGEMSIIYNDTVIDYYVYFSCFQIEEKDHATPFVNGTRNQTTVYDCSGYNNDGTITGSLSANSNTPRYEYSTYITDGRTNYIKSPTIYMSGDAITVNIWVNSSNTSPYTNYHIPFAASPGSYCEISITNTGAFRAGLSINGTRYVSNSSGYNVLDGNWHMLSMTYNGTIIKRYIDGTLLDNTTNVTGTLNATNQQYYIGKYGAENTYGCREMYLSDVRLYTTALSEQDIKDLYNTSAYIDNGQNLHCYEFTEDDVISPEIEKTGIVKTQEFNEFPDDVVLYDYIESTGTQYIDTGIIMKESIKIDCVFQSLRNSLVFIYGTTNSNAELTSWSASSNANWRFGHVALNPMVSYTPTDINRVIHDKTGITINGVQQGTYSGTFSFNNTTPINIFGNSVDSSSSIKLYYFKIYDNDVLVRDYLPCTKNGVACLWDRVNNQFYGNAGTGTFTLGNPIQTVTSLYQDKINTKQMIEL